MPSSPSSQPPQHHPSQQLSTDNEEDSDNGMPQNRNDDIDLKKLKQIQQNEIFYNKLKMSIIPTDRLQSEPIALSSVFEPPHNESEMQILNKLKELNSMLNHRKSNTKIIYEGLGAQLSKFKYSHYVLCKKCKKCRKPDLQHNLFAALKCQKCIKKSNLKPFFITITNILGYGKTYVNCLIYFAKLCSEFPKIKNSSVPFSEIRKHMTFLSQRLKEDIDFWQQI